jgi:hypothetical protein
MFSIRRSATTGRLRSDLLSRLYRRFSTESTREARGLRLLREWLTPAQWHQFEARGYFDVRGCDSGKKYRIHRGRMTNVYEIDDLGRVGAGWCFVPFGFLAAGDVMLAQKIALETFESAALAVANRFSPRGRVSRGDGDGPRGWMDAGPAD